MSLESLPDKAHLFFLFGQHRADGSLLPVLRGRAESERRADPVGRRGSGDAEATGDARSFVWTPPAGLVEALIRS